jgi:hypothetical protein
MYRNKAARASVNDVMRPAVRCMLQEADGPQLAQDHRPTRGGGRAPELIFTAKERHALPIEQRAVAIVGDRGWRSRTGSVR